MQVIIISLLHLHSAGEEKVSEPLGIILGQTFFGSNDFKEGLWVALDRMCTIFRRNLLSFLLTELLELSHNVGFLVSTALTSLNLFHMLLPHQAFTELQLDDSDPDIIL